MKRFHVHVQVENLDESIRFYATMFGVQPDVAKPDYAKWMLEDPRINFAISQRGSASGINHLGFQLDNDEELQAMRAQLQAADAALVEQVGTSCCYAQSNKYWVKDPSGIAWETFHTLGEVPIYSADDPPLATTRTSASASTTAVLPRPCCTPRQQASTGCC